MSRPLSVALDLGSTRLKAAALRADGSLTPLGSGAPPPLAGRDPARTFDAAKLLIRATRLLRRALRDLPRGMPLGIASQRSSFVLWDRATGRPAIPALSWQDRQAAGWCERHARLAPVVERLTGLRLSPHYAACKLAFLMGRDRRLRADLASGRLLFGTLETWLLWNWTEGRRHATDLTMAARTLLADPLRGGWSEGMLELFGVPRAAMPGILPTFASRGIPTFLGSTVRARAADQASAALAVTGWKPGITMVNLGTGCFVLRTTGSRWTSVPGYLSGPILATPRLRRYALEGTINAGGAVADRFHPGPTPFPKMPAPDAFCLPDDAGIGAPHWRAGRRLTFSPAAAKLSGGEKRRVVLEGILFRVREILEGISGCRSDRILVSGGLAREPFVAAGLASCLERPVEVLPEAETTLLGAARLAAGLPPAAGLAAHRVDPDPRGGYLPAQFRRWLEWSGKSLRS